MLTVEEELIYLRTMHELEDGMADEKQADDKKAAEVKDTPAAVVKSGVELLEARVTELENVVHQLTLHTLSSTDHPGVLAWLEKIGARIKAAVEKVL